MLKRKINESAIINVIFDLKGFKYQYLFNLKLNIEKSLGKEFKDFSRLKNHRIDNDYNLYLSRNGIVIKELDKNEKISQSEIKTGDTVIITDKKINIVSQGEKLNLQELETIVQSEETIYREKISNKSKRSIKNKPIMKYSKKFKIILFSISLVLIIGIGVIIYYFLTRKNEQKENPSSYKKEDLIININYKTDILYTYENNKIFKMKEEKKSKKDSSTKEQLLLADIFFIIKNHLIELNKEANKSRDIFSGYMGIYNMTIENETNNMQIIYNKQLIETINLNNIMKIKIPDLTYIKEEENICFVKINFYGNGEIINISYPIKKFDLSNMQYIRDYAKLIIPKISSDLYSDNINDTIKTLLSSNDTDTNVSYNLRELNDKNDRIIQQKIRRISTNDSLQNFEIEEFLTPSDKISQNLELREKINCSNCSEQNLYEISVNNINSDEIDTEGGSLNKSIFRTVNKDGILESIIELENIILKKDDDEDYMDNEDKYEENESNYTQGNNYDFPFDIENLSFDNINKILLKDKTSNDEIIKSLYKYFDEFQYELFNETFYNEYMTSQMLNNLIKENNLTEDQLNITYRNKNDFNNGKRRASEINYYGMAKTVNKRDLYNYNLIGLVMQSQIFNEFNPATGIAQSYIITTFGNKNMKIKSSEIYSNLHIILEKKNQMIFNLIKLVNQSNYDLKERNKNITNIIIDLENNLLDLFNDIDYSDLFRDHLDIILEQLNNLNGNIFDELIKLINIVYNNYSIILQDVMNEKYNVFEIIRNITKEDYIKYIFNMINILEIFHNSTLAFLDEIEEEINNLTKIEKLDFLYDILDSIYDCKLILKQFNKYLFKSIEKGILLFEVDLYDFIDYLIGDLIYITDYLSININKNELMIKTYNKSEREILTFKLNRIKEIIIIIFEQLLSNIKSDYNFEMSINDNQSIKYFSEIKSKTFLDETEKRSSEIIKNIKAKIRYMDIYEIFSENLDFINLIHNKTIIEFIDDSFDNIVKNILKVEPEYFNKSSDLIIKKNDLFNKSKLIINEINNEISEISVYIKNYLEEYKEQNLYNIYYNLNIINELFFDNEIKFLSDELIRLIKDTISMHLKRLNSNYKLLSDYLDELKYHILKVHGGETTFVGKGFLEKFTKFLGYFNSYVSSIISDNSEIFMNLEINFFKIKNDIFNFLKNKLLSINNYGFDTNIYKDNFYFIRQMNAKLLIIFDKINQHFTEEKFSLLKAEILKLFMDKIQNYNEQKITEFNDLYQYIFGFTWGLYNTEKDFEYQFRTWLGKKKVRTCWLDKTTNNIKLINNSFPDTIEFVNNNVKILIDNFKNKVDTYLSKYINDVQGIYKKINLYLQTKIKSHNNINLILNNYKSVFNILLNNDSNIGLIQKILLLDNKKNINLCLENIDINLKILSEKYFIDYYSRNYTSFLEYPEEIEYKINNFNNVIKALINLIKQKVNVIYKNRIENIIKSVNNFIFNIVESHRKYIIIHLNKKDIPDEYLKSKINYINNYFNDFCLQINNLSKDIFNSNNQNNYLKNIELYLSQENYDLPINTYLKNIQLFQTEFNLTINKDFNEENCMNILDTYNSEFIKGENTIDYLNEGNSVFLNEDEDEEKEEIKNVFCSIALNKNSFNNYEYNYNIVKLRSGLYYTKNIIENIMDIPDKLSYDEILIFSKFNDIEFLLNDNNILYIHNSSIYKLNEINENSLTFFDESNEKIIEDISSKYNIKEDYYIFLNEFKKLLNFENKNIKKYIIDYMYNSLNSLFNEFNNTLYEQKNKFDFYNIKNMNMDIFKNIFLNYYNLIENKYIINYNHITNLKNNIQFKNVLHNFISKLQYKKRTYFKEKINEFSKKYNLHSLNITLNIGEYFEKYIEQQYEDLEFEYIFEYVKIYENYIQNYFNNIIKYFNDNKNLILNRFFSLTDDFLKTFKEGASNFVDNKFIEEIKKNYSDCLGYSMDLLNETIEEDNINYEKYLNYTNILEYINSNCSTDDIISEEINNCLYNISQIEEVTFYNKTEHLLYCHKNNYFNYSIKIFDNFEDIYKNKLDELINKILIIIEKNNLDINFLNSFLEKEFELKPYDLKEDDLLGDLEGYEDMTIYINYTYNSYYQDYLKELLIDSFQESYINYINNYLIDYLKENINIYINTKLDFYTEYLTEKISNEFDYYVFLFNKTKEIGMGTQNTFSHLYKNSIYKNLKFCYEVIEEDVLFYINILYRKNKYLFKENYINYFFNELNEYNIELYGLKEFINEIIYDENFNKSLNSYSNILMKELIFEKLNETFINNYNDKMSHIVAIIENYNNKIIEILAKIKKNEDNININKIIKSY